MDLTCFKEVIISSADVPSTHPNIYVWDPQNGNGITTYKEGFVLSKSLCTVGQDYLACTLRNTPIIKFNGFKKGERSDHKIIVPGTVTALAVSPSGSYCVAGIGKNLYVWNISTGELESILPGHVSEVTCLKFTDDGWYFVSAADTTVAVWRLNEVVLQRSQYTQEPINPIHRWSDHTSDITDLYVGFGGHRARIVTVSSDYTCKVYDLSLGGIIFSIFGDISFSSVVMDPSEYYLFIGSDKGNIYRINLFACLQERSIDFIDNEAKDVFRGHTKRVSCLATSCDGLHLASGSDDGTLKIWYLETKMCIHTVTHSAPVTNVFFTIASESFFSNEKFRPSIVFKQFQKSQQPFELKAIERRLKSAHPSSVIEPCDEKFNSVSAKGVFMVGAQIKAKLEEDLNQVSQSNKQLFAFSMSHLMHTMDNYKTYYD